ncbi:MAG: glutathione S-transferase family protein, partial [Pseudomonadota bacterium]
MVLFGRNLSPFTRRVAIWCALQGREVERRQVMVTGPEWETLKDVTPVGRVPALVLEDGTVLVESSAIIDWLEDSAPEGKRLLPPTGTARRDMLQLIGRATSISEKGVNLVYERTRRPEQFHWLDYHARIESQITSGLAELEAMAPASGWFGGDAPNAADISVV